MSYQSTILDDNPIRYYRGSIIDIGSQGQNGTVNGVVNTGQPGLLPNGDMQTSMLTDGNVGSYISIPTAGLPTGGGPITIECWARWPSIASVSFDALFDMGVRVESEELALIINGSSDLIATVFSSHNADPGVAVQANQTYYWASSYDGATLLCDVFPVGGGHAQGSLSYGAGNITYGFAAIMGPILYNLSNHAYGQEFAVYNYVLSSAQRQTHFIAGTTNSASTVAPIPGALPGNYLFAGDSRVPMGKRSGQGYGLRRFHKRTVF